MLKFKTDGQELFYLDGGDVIVGDTIRYLEAEFDLSDDWKSFPEVTAYFKCGAAINSIILTGGKIKAEDNLALAPGVWSVYLRAYELEGEEIKRQITSSTAKINVLSHGKFTGREFVPENADAYEKRMTEMRNYLVFEEYNPTKKYVKGNKVSYEGSSYVLTADSAMGTNPTDGESWLLIAQRGNDGTRIFEFPFKDYGAEVGRIYEIGSLGGLEDFYGQTIPGIDSWRVGDYFLSEDGKMLIIEDMLKSYGVVRFVTVRCLADIKGKDGKDGEKGTTIHTVENFGFGKTTPVGMYFVNNKKGATSGVIYKDFTMPKGFVHGDLLFDGKNGLMFDHDYREYSYTKDDVTYFETYDVIWCIANLNGKDAVVDQEFDGDSENAIANKTVAMKVNEIFSVMSAIEGTSARIDLSNVANADFKAKAEAAGVGGDAGLAGEGGGGFKKIGFTDDCDYIATESDGHSAFSRAVSEANDGDVIIVTAGTYNGSYTVAIEKNITFVGTGKPIIKFPIIIGSYTQANTVNFDNFEFGNNMQCRAVDEWTPSKLYIYNSRFYNSTTKLIGTFSNCKFDTATVSGAVSYAGDDAICAVNYNDCDIIDSTIGGDNALYRNCTIRESSTPSGYSVYYTGCSLYNFTNKMSAAYQTALLRCVLYGNALPDGYNPTEYHECYLVSGVAL